MRGSMTGGLVVRGLVLASWAWMALGAQAASGSEIDSEHLFGLTEGSDIGSKGERELELEAGGRLGKGGSAYRVLSQATALKLTLTDSFRVSPLIAFDHHHIRSVPGMADRSSWALGEVAFEMKYRALDRRTSPFGLTFSATPHWSPIDETSGDRASSWGGSFAALADRELIANRLFAAINLGFDTGASRVGATRVWEHDSGLGASGALSLRLSERVFAAAEVRFESAFDGMALDRYAGHAWFAGPSIYARLAENVWMSVVWSAQIAGHATGDPRSLDLVNFERHLVKGRLGISF
jgi:hypothetical protein